MVVRIPTGGRVPPGSFGSPPMKSLLLAGVAALAVAGYGAWDYAARLRAAEAAAADLLVKSPEASSKVPEDRGGVIG